MLKIIYIFTLLLFSIANANELPNFNMKETQILPKEIENKKKNYNDLIAMLSESNNPEYLFYLAIIYTNGISDKDDFGNIVKQDSNKAIFYYKKSFDYGYYNAAAVLGAMYLYNQNFIILPNNIKESKKWLQLALKNKVYESTTFLAEIYFNYEKNPKKGLQLLFLGAEKNNATAQIMVATLYGYGYKQGTFELKKNEAMGSEFLTLACTNKNKTKKVQDFCYKYAEKIENKK